MLRRQNLKEKITSKQRNKKTNKQKLNFFLKFRAGQSLFKLNDLEVFDLEAFFRKLTLLLIRY